MAYRNDLEALSARHAALTTEVAERSKELADARRLLDQAEARAKLPVLDDVRVAAPCPADWGAMTGDARVRACTHCKQRVYNLSAMTRDEAEALLREREGQLCVRYFRRADGTILVDDCGPGVRKRRRRRLIVAGLAASVAGYVAITRAMEREATAPTFDVPTTEAAQLIHADGDAVRDQVRGAPHRPATRYLRSDDRGEWIMGRK